MPGLKHIEVPKPVVLCDPESGEPLTEPKADGSKKPKDPITFRSFWFRMLHHHPMWGAPFENMASAVAISDSLNREKDGWITMAEEDWKKLEAAARSPSYSIPSPMGGWDSRPGFDAIYPALNAQLVPLIKAILDAKDSLPEKKAE